jgi:YD repeat-containing protein
VASTQYEYDALGRVIKATSDNGHSITYTYDAAGNITSVVSTGRCSAAVSGRIGGRHHDDDDDLTLGGVAGTAVGRRVGGHDNHKLTFDGVAGEPITLRLEAMPPQAGIGKFATISLRRRGHHDDDDHFRESAEMSMGQNDHDDEHGGFSKHVSSALPAELTVVLPSGGRYVVRVKDADDDYHRHGHDRRESYEGPYRLTLEGSPAACASFAANNAGIGMPLPRKDALDWRMQIQVASQGYEDVHNYLGVAPEAALEWDANDGYTIPQDDDSKLSLYFPHNTWEQNPGRYSSDIRNNREQAGAVTGHVWHFDVEKSFSTAPAGDEVELRFSGLDVVPTAYAILFVDHELSRVADLRQEESYTFYLGTQGTGSFDDNTLAQNRPNPFNPSTIIRYDLAERGLVRLRVYDVTGALVKVLEERERGPGGYEVPWNGDNENGERVASGVYLYRLTTPGFSQTRKMLLLK